VIDCGADIQRVGESTERDGTWPVGSTRSSQWWHSRDAETVPIDLSACVQRGRVLLAHRAACDPGTHGDSLFVAYLGGYSDVTLPSYLLWPTMPGGAAWDLTWLPYDLPEDVGWTWAGAGTRSITQDGEYVVTAANTGYQHRPPTGTSLTDGVMGRFVIRQAAGGSLGNDEIAYRVRIGDGAAHAYRVSFRVASTGIRIWDVYASAILATITTDLTVPVEVEYHLTEAGLVVQWRPWSTSEDHLWTRIGPYVCADGLVAVAHLVEWGHIDAGNAESYWLESHYSSGSYVGVGWVGWTYPDDLYPRSVSTYPVYAAAGLSISSSAGPGVAGDTWTATPWYRYGVDKLATLAPHSYESPRRPWRSTQMAAAEYIAFSLGSGAAEEVLQSDLLCVGLFATNLQTALIQGYDVDTAAWVTLLTLSSALGTALTWTRYGTTLVPGAAAGGSAPYLLPGDVDGGTFLEGGDVVRISRATEGKWGVPTGTAVRQGVLQLASVGGLGASGVAGAIHAPRMVGIVKLGGVRYSGYRIRIPIQTTPDGYYEIGSLLVGTVEVFARITGHGRSITTEDGAEVTTYRDGTRARYAPAPPSRTVEIAWPDTIPTRQAWFEADPDYIRAAAGGPPVAALAVTPWLLERLYGESQGAPVIYLPTVPYAGATATLLRREQAVYGYLQGPIRRSVVVGDEAEDEVVRVDSVTIREIT
jgi:hypothetical protein